MNGALHGWRILVTRPAPQAETLCRLINEQGGEAVKLPTIKIAAPANPPSIAERLSVIKPGDLGVFISRNAVIWALKYLEQCAEKLQGLKLLAVGCGTASELSRAGIENVEYAETSSDSEALLTLPALQTEKVQGKNILIFRGEGGRELLAETLRERGAKIAYVEVYRRIRPAYPSGMIAGIFNSGAPDIVVVTSAQGLKNLLGMLSSDCRRSLQKTQLVTISDRLASLAEDTGFVNKPVVAEHASNEGILAAIIKTAGAQKNDRSGKGQRTVG